MAAHNDDEDIDQHLNKVIPLSLTKKREGPGRTMLTYVESHTVIDIANDTWGHGGWSDYIVEYKEYTTDQRTYNIIVLAKVVVHQTNAQRMDFGFGSGDKEKAFKEASSDALKRCLRKFGPLLGNCLYAKDYETVRVKGGGGLPASLKRRRTKH